MLDSRGSSPRNYKNTLVFLAPDATRLRELQQAARQYLAWKSIGDDRESLNLDPFQQRQADTKLKTAKWDYGLKSVAKALGAYDANYLVAWPGSLDAGLRAMVMGWRAYQAANPLETVEMKTLTQYLEIDCKAMWTILRWLRAQA